MIEPAQPSHQPARKPRKRETKRRNAVLRAPTLPLVIGLAGPMGSGKSTAAKDLAKRAGFEILPFAEPLKRMLLALGVPHRNLYGSQREKAEPLALLGGRSARDAMKTLGTEWGRELISPTLWVNAWKKSAAGRVIIADDVRFPNEAAAVRALGGVVIRIERPDRGERPGAETADSHASERIAFAADLTIANDGSRSDLGRRIRSGLAAIECRSKRRRI